VIFVAAMVLTLVSLGSLALRDSQHWSRETRSSHSLEHDSRDAAYHAAQTSLKKRLWGYSSFEFPAPVPNGHDVDVLQLPDGSYRIKAWVDARSWFGSKSRLIWSCQLKLTRNTGWTPVGFCGVLRPHGAGELR